MAADLGFYVVVYERIDGVVSCEDSGLCLSTDTRWAFAKVKVVVDLESES